MTKRKPEPVPVLVCRWRGCDDRFFGKYKDAAGAWVRIPGGAFPPAINTRTRAEAFARDWYAREAGVQLRKSTMTFRALGEAWTEGELHKQYPDHIKVKSTAGDDAGRLKNYVYPVVGGKAVSAVTLDDAQEVMRRLPATLSPITRRSIAATMCRLLKLAVFPLRLIPANPIPAGFLPSRGARKALAVLYPDEVRRLLGYADVPLAFRLLWGFLTAEGCREGEALALTWADLELKRGLIRLDRNKTDDPRAWALLPGTAAALRAYRERYRKHAGPGEHVFLDPHGRPHTKFGMAELLRDHLDSIGLKVERPELFESTTARRRMRVHDLRGTFVTAALANGKTEAWISDRTGHRSSAMIHTYKRMARSFEELGLGDLTPLDQAIPELGNELGHGGSGGDSGPAGNHENSEIPAKEAVGAEFKSRWGRPSNREKPAALRSRKRAADHSFELGGSLWLFERCRELGDDAPHARQIHASAVKG